jgi:hypothetical protein
MTPITVEQDHAHKARMIRTMVKNIDHWEANIHANRPRIVHDVSELWRDSESGEYLCVAAGPSLKSDLPKLKEMEKGRTIVCVDMAYKFLLENGVVPTYVLSTDASEKIANLLDTGIPGSTLILNVISHPEVSRTWKQDIYWFVMSNQFYDADRKEMVEAAHMRWSGITGKILPGGNVSSMALGFALSVRNASKVYLFGHDFCWKDEMYCGGINKNMGDERIKNEMESGTLYEVENTKGETAFTNLSLMQYSKWHEETSKNFNGRVVNCSSNTILKI